jgi:hypothetical protein
MSHRDMVGKKIAMVKQVQGAARAKITRQQQITAQNHPGSGDEKHQASFDFSKVFSSTGSITV